MEIGIDSFASAMYGSNALRSVDAADLNRWLKKYYGIAKRLAV
jgi:hypothetical protein